MDSQEGKVNDSGENAATDSSALIDRLKIIEEQPLDRRADAYTALYDEASRVLNNSDSE